MSSSCVVQGMLVEVGKVGGKLSLENGVRNCIAYIYIYIIIIIFQEILQTWRVTLFSSMLSYYHFTDLDRTVLINTRIFGSHYSLLF